MNWLLITGLYNPGDCFARFGVDRLIKEIDPDATFHLLNKEDEDAWDPPREYDRAVLCGMPLFWSHPQQTCSEIWWWEKMFRGWLFEDPRKFMAMGVGNFIGKHGLHNEQAYMDAIMEVIECCWAVTTRNPILDHPALIDSICPSVFSIEADQSLKQSDAVRLCNLMRDGGHEAHLDPEEVAVWKRLMPELAEMLKKDGYEFVAHSGDEAVLAAELGFRSIHIFIDPRKYLELYSRCIEYVGNRLHGAMVAFKAGASVTAIGYDSRVKMLHRVGCGSYTPSEFSKFMRPGYSLMLPGNEAMIECERQKMKELLIKFRNQ
jgi:hypothetical protein